MSRPPILSQEDIEQIKTLYKQGRKVSDLAINYLVDRKTIHYHLLHAGLLKKQPQKKRVYTITRDSKPRPQKQKSSNEMLDKKARNVWGWKEFPKERAYPKNYDEYCKRRKINLKKYFSSHCLTKEENLNNRGTDKFF